jgi:hypothetical protein
MVAAAVLPLLGTACTSLVGVPSSPSWEEFGESNWSGYQLPSETDMDVVAEWYDWESTHLYGHATPEWCFRTGPHSIRISQERRQKHEVTEDWSRYSLNTGLWMADTDWFRTNCP